jgi:flotillin
MDTQELMQYWPVGVAAGLGLLVTGIMVWVSRRLLYICAPNEILIFSGRRHTTPDGRQVGFRVVTGGRAVRVPIVETVEQMDVSLISVPMAVNGAYSQGGIPLTVHAIANVKVSTDPAVVTNAIERFLGRSRDEIARVAKETLEGHLRGVLATMTPEQVNEDRLTFASRLADEAGEDLRKLGLQLDTLKFQHVADDRKYLDSIGRTRVAEIIREAEVAESDAVRSAEEAESRARGRGEVAQTRAQATIQQKQNELRRVRAELDAQAKSEEERAIAAAEAARAEAEKELQRIRGELETLRLQADVTIPAEADRRATELEAAGHAALAAEQGKATAQALDLLADAWKKSNGRAMDIVVLQQIEEIVGKVCGAAAKIEVGSATVLDGGDGKALAAYASARPQAVSALLDEIARTTGVDVTRILKGAAS